MLNEVLTSVQKDIEFHIQRTTHRWKATGAYFSTLWRAINFDNFNDYLIKKY